MVKYGRLVFEEEISDNTTAKDALIILLNCMKNAQLYLKEEDVEMSESPYERME